MPVKAHYLAPDGKLQLDLTEAEIIKAYESARGLLWLDCSETTEADAGFMEESLRFHHLAVEDCLSPLIHPPKIDDFGDYLFIIVHGINHAAESDIVETAEIAFFIGKNFIVSNHNFPSYSIGAAQQMVEENPRLMSRGADFLAHTIIDIFIDNVMPTIDRMSDVAEEIEEEVIRRPHQNILDGILKLKRSTLKIHRVMAPQREVLNRLSRGEFAMIKKEAQIFYRDVYDHIVRIEDLNQTILDRADNAMATYLSAVANRQNETMRVLSIVATIFLPLTLLAGIYGMNFEYMPELRWKYGYFMVLGVILVAVLVLIWRFWASGWFAWGKRRILWVRPFKVDSKKIRGYFAPSTKRRGQSANRQKTH
ncbi:MAG: magnesium/cobalt transporter CorA [Chloroflexota bacterium]